MEKTPRRAAQHHRDGLSQPGRGRRRDRVPELGISDRPEPGALLIWNNADPDGVPNPYTLHAGTPVVRGVKYIITKWYRSRKWL